MRGKPRSHLDLPTEEREQIDYCVHNNPPKILYTLNLISPSLKIDHSALQERLRFVLCLVGSYLLLLERQSVGRSAVFFVCYIQANRRSTILINISRAAFKLIFVLRRVNFRIIRPRVSYYLYSATLGFDALEILLYLLKSV